MTHTTRLKQLEINMAFLETHDLQEKFDTMADYATDIAALQAAADAGKAVDAQLLTLLQTDAQTITTLQAQVAALPPSVDTTGLESAIAELQASNAAKQAALTPTTPVTDPTGTTTPVDTTAAPVASTDAPVAS